MIACVFSHFVFHRTFPHSKVCYFVDFYHQWTELNDCMKRAGLVNRAGSLFKDKTAWQNEPTCFQLTSCNSVAISTELTPN